MTRTLPLVKEVVLELRPSGILEIILNTPENYNSIGDQKYQDIIDALSYATKTSAVKAVILSAKGKFFSSGASLSKARLDAVVAGQPASIGASMAQRYVDVLIDFPKLLVAAVQGPAYGISVTTLPFFDLVYCSSDATFTTPFSSLGICLEGCSSVTFPPLLGQALATRLLYLAETVTVDELAKTGLVAEVLPKENMANVVLGKLEMRLAGLSITSIIASKRLVRDSEVRKQLHRVNEKEMKVVAKRMQSKEHREALIRFQEKREKRKSAGTAKL